MDSKDEIFNQYVIPENDLIGDDKISNVEIIDINDVESRAKNIATKLVNKVRKLYYTDSDMKADSYVSTVVARSIDSITLLEKMLLSNNLIHDKLLMNICLNSENSSLYMSLTRIQDATIEIQNTISKELNTLREHLYERHIEESEEGQEDDEDVPQTAFRGGKDFIKSLRAGEEVNS